MKLHTLHDIKILKGKRVLLRVDFNVPLKNGSGLRRHSLLLVSDDTRIQESLPTITHLQKEGARVIIATHLGRPDGKPSPEFRLDPVAKHLEKLLGTDVVKLDDCIGKKVEVAISNMKDGDVLMLENMRFHAEEELNDPAFSQALASLADLFVNEAFGASHRAHSSVCGVAKFLPAYAGLLMEKEISALSPLLHHPHKPLTLIIGGAKIDTKIGLLKNFLDIADTILIGGGLANTFLASEGFNIGASFYEEQKVEVARDIVGEAELKGKKILIPEDVVVADEIGETVETAIVPVEDVEGHMKILDIGEKTRRKFIEEIEKSRTIIWNGPLGLYEFTPFASGTKEIAKAISILHGKATTVIGGGDTIDALHRAGIDSKQFTHISTGGGAMLEFLEGKKLPGIEALKR